MTLKPNNTDVTNDVSNKLERNQRQPKQQSNDVDNI